MSKFKHSKIITKQLEANIQEMYFKRTNEVPGFTFVSDISEATVFENSKLLRYALQKLLPYFTYMRGISVKEFNKNNELIFSKRY
jgi:hypothetical protein